MIAGERSAVVITPCCCCSRGLGCAPARSPRSSSRTSTGAAASSRFAAKEHDLTMLPLPVDVGRGDRQLSATPSTAARSRAVFLLARAPFCPLSWEHGLGDRASRVHSRRVAGGSRSPAAAYRRDRAAAGGRVAAGGRAGAATPPARDHDDLRQGRPPLAQGTRAAMAGRCVMSSLRDAVDDYLALRRSLGYQLYGHELLLHDFARLRAAQQRGHGHDRAGGPVGAAAEGRQADLVGDTGSGWSAGSRGISRRSTRGPRSRPGICCPPARNGSRRISTRRPRSRR